MHTPYIHPNYTQSITYYNFSNCFFFFFVFLFVSGVCFMLSPSYCSCALAFALRYGIWFVVCVEMFAFSYISESSNAQMRWTEQPVLSLTLLCTNMLVHVRVYSLWAIYAVCFSLVVVIVVVNVFFFLKKELLLLLLYPPFPFWTFGIFAAFSGLHSNHFKTIAAKSHHHLMMMPELLLLVTLRNGRVFGI